ncbi:MAG: ECF transporter S component [Eubacteriales bacterium]|nr:ECF transporter S component [Eubacteriales bacterium]
MYKTENQKIKTGKMARMSILIAIIIIMTFTPLGYLKIGAVEITFMMIPVVIGAIILGPGAGAFFGGVFGLTSFMQCFGISPFGTALMGINPIFTFILCMVPRILMGWFAGLIFKALYKIDKTKIISFAVASLSGALLNTVLFVGALILFFGNSSYIRQFGDSTIAIIGVLVTVNALVEAIVCLIVGSAVSKALAIFLPIKEIRNMGGRV